MQISDDEVKKFLRGRGRSKPSGKLSPPEPIDDELMKTITSEVLAMSDREDRIVELRCQIKAGRMPGTGEEVVDSMIRRSIADSIAD